MREREQKNIPAADQHQSNNMLYIAASRLRQQGVSENAGQVSGSKSAGYEEPENATQNLVRTFTKQLTRPRNALQNPNQQFEEPQLNPNQHFVGGSLFSTSIRAVRKRLEA